ncbi:DNA photolyase [Gracilaria domingensis]|nr:DNA photolyase [Gracilaria domingensis]
MSSHASFVGSFVGDRFHVNASSNERHQAICMSANAKSPEPAPRRSVVWYREGDLRVDDHPGLSAASRQTAEVLAPLLVCTPRTSLRTLQAAKRMQRELKERGSHLAVRFSENEAKGVVDFINEYKADSVYVHVDVEHEARSIVQEVASKTNGSTEIREWNSSLLDWGDVTESLLKDMPDEYPEFQRWNKRKAISMPSFPVDVQEIRQDSGLEEQEFSLSDVTKQVLESRHVGERREQFDVQFEKDQLFVNAIKSNPDSDGFGEEAIKEFLQTSDANENPDPGRSIAEVLHQGALSPRRIYQIVHDHERRNGRLWRPFYREGAKQLLELLDAKEFATVLARRDISFNFTVDGEHEPKFWKWRGFLVRYVEEGKEHSSQGKPPLLLIHGFGASSQHYRRSIQELKTHYHVYAVDLIGFGRSEKPPTQYTQAFWECLIWDFVEKVVKQPVFIAGNSIGGYFACAFGADAYPTHCKGVCLINSAGKLEDLNSPQVESARNDSLFQYVMKNSAFARMFAANILLKSLRGRIDKTLRLVYPTNPEAADEQLFKEIRRNSLDYSAASVLASGLILPPPRSLSQLLKKYEGPLLVFQGELDPLNNAKGRADTIHQQYPEARVIRVQAGYVSMMRMISRRDTDSNILSFYLFLIRVSH